MYMHRFFGASSEEKALFQNLCYNVTVKTLDSNCQIFYFFQPQQSYTFKLFSLIRIYLYIYKFKPSHKLKLENEKAKKSEEKDRKKLHAVTRKSITVKCREFKYLSNTKIDISMNVYSHTYIHVCIYKSDLTKMVAKKRKELNECELKKQLRDASNATTHTGIHVYIYVCVKYTHTHTNALPIMQI